MNNYITGILAYNPSNERFGMLVMDLWKIDGFHCGDCFEVWNSEEEKWIPDRIEKGHFLKYDPYYNKRKIYEIWYLVKTRLSGENLEGLRIRVEN